MSTKVRVMICQNEPLKNGQEFHELRCLTQLAESNSFFDQSLELTETARVGLQHLQEFIEAESLTFVLCDTALPTQTGIFKRFYHFGKHELNSDNFSQILKLAGANYFCEAYINNQVEAEALFHEPQIYSLLIVPALSEQRCLGWMVAINKTSNMPDSPGRFQRSLRQDDFTTNTALLMESAGRILATHAHHLQLIVDQQELLIGTVRTLINTLDAKDKYTCGHSDRVALIAKGIAHQYGLNQQDCLKIYLTGLLHDIGKIGVRDEVLSKPGQLTPAEFDEIKMHPVYGYDILQHLGQLQHVLAGVLHHHESWDGRGYPHQLAGTKIPLDARILAVADAYDAMTSDRPYRKGMPCDKAEAILKKGAGQQWDAEVVEAFFQIIEQARRIVKGKVVRSYLPVNMQLYGHNTGEHDVEEDLIKTAVKTTTAIR